MALPPEVERVIAAGKRQEAQRARRREKIDEFMNWAREIFGEKLPFFIPSFVDTEKHIRQPYVKWKHADRSMMDDRYWRKCMEDALTEDKKDGCIQVKLGPQSFNLCSLDIDADE